MHPSPIAFQPYDQLDDEPSIIVDGYPHASTLITLSHWPRSGTPVALKADTSTEIAFRYLDRPALHVAATAASNTHFDEDGLAGLFTVLQPEPARRHRDLLCDFATAGDFGTYRCLDAALAVFVTNAYADPERSPLGPAFFERPEADVSADLYRELLERLPDILENPEAYRPVWADEARFLRESEHAVQSGAIHIEERRDLDLAIVTIPPGAPRVALRRLGRRQTLPCHPMALYNATSCLRVLYVEGRRYELEYRYESWVEYVSRRPMGRVDLSPLATRLTGRETNGATWRFDGVSEISPRLQLANGDESSLGLTELRSELERFLAEEPVAWNPYA